MARRNRVTPYGEIISTAARGTLMGNRGCLHDSEGNLTRNWTTKAWITCLLVFKGRKRVIMAPNRYTELFFLDEATALAAGHRPCGECRRDRFNEFKSLWLSVNATLLPIDSKAITAIDQVIHQERVTNNKQKQTFQDKLVNLPEGIFVRLNENQNQYYLVFNQNLHLWSSAGYIKNRKYSPSEIVTVLTPRSIVKTIAAGFKPEIKF